MPTTQKKRGRPPGSLNKLSKESRENLAYVLNQTVTDLSKRLHKMSDRDKIAFVVGLAPYVWPKVKPEELDPQTGPQGDVTLIINRNNSNSTNHAAPKQQNTKEEKIAEKDICHKKNSCNENDNGDEEDGCDEEYEDNGDETCSEDDCSDDESPAVPPPKRCK